MKTYFASVGADGDKSGANTHSKEGAELGRRISSMLKRGALD